MTSTVETHLSASESPASESPAFESPASESSVSESSVSQSIVCPLCPLCCDDVAIDEQGRLHVEGCRIVDRFDYQVDRGQLTTEDNLANRTHHGSPRLRVSTTGIDLITARHLNDAVMRGDIELTIETDVSIDALSESVSRDGGFSATLADVAAHADTMLLVGCVEDAWPRILHQLRFSEAVDASKIVDGNNVVDGNPVVDGSVAKLYRRARLSADELGSWAARMFQNADIEGQPKSGSRDESLLKWIDSFANSSYAAVIVGPGAFAAGEEVISAAMIGRIIRKRNETTRAVCLTLDAAATLRSVFLWRTNTSPEATDDRLAEALDVRIGSPLNENAKPAKLQIGGRDPGPDLAIAYRAASIAGLNVRSMVIRGDGSVTLPLAAPIVSNDQPSVMKVLADVMRSRDSG